MEDLHKKRTGTSFKGYVYVTYPKLVALFGQPTCNGDNYKVDAEWVIDTPQGVATIYNYKDGRAYLGDDGLAVEDICEWHVGGKNIKTYEWIRNKLTQALKVGSEALNNRKG